jgi:hypothetical protein
VEGVGGRVGGWGAVEREGEGSGSAAASLRCERGAEFLVPEVSNSVLVDGK